MNEHDRKDPNMFLRILFVTVQMSWGLLQTMAGLIVFLAERKQPHDRYRLAVHTCWRNNDHGISLGLFIFTGDKDGYHDKAHEYGHSIQSLILGPLYLLLIGLPSYIHCLIADRTGQTEEEYKKFYTEAWAERLAGRDAEKKA